MCIDSTTSFQTLNFGEVEEYAKLKYALCNTRSFIRNFYMRSSNIRFSQAKIEKNTCEIAGAGIFI